MKRHEIEIRGGEIDWKNFSGVERTQIVDGRPQIVNAAGKRGFAVKIDPTKSEVYFDNELVTDPNFGQTLYDLGYRVNIRAGKEDGDPAQYRLPVEIRFPEPGDKNTRYIPKIYQVTTDGREILLDEDTICNLDESDVVRADVLITNSTAIDRKTGEERAKTWCNLAYFWLRERHIGPRAGYMPAGYEEEDA